ncbi:MAG: class I SAM-dependent methyltransferase [Candidatus Omnitrophica bacterium]|nr:class I SAM-dependent methyltransferase [Candidatus Omnitrophota bacterium]
MRVRESGMMAPETWENLFDTQKIFATLKLNHRVENVVELGCGYGTFTIPAAQIISGKITALDSNPQMIQLTAKRAKLQKCDNVTTIQKDFITTGSGEKNRSMDYVMIFNVLDSVNQNNLLIEAKRVLKKWGRVALLQWQCDPDTPGGPDLTIRPAPEQCIEWARQVGLKLLERQDFQPYHYGLLFEKGDTFDKGVTH